MRIRCGRCGHAKILFTTCGGRFGDHHGAICAWCWKVITLKDCLFSQAVAVSMQGETDIFRQVSEKKQEMGAVVGLTKPVGKVGKR